MSILVFGSVNVDIFAYAPRLPRPGETLHGTDYTISLGGKGANQAVAAARLGAAVDLIGRTGRDSFGTLARGRLTEAGVGLQALHEDPGSRTGIAVINVDRTGENCITVIAGANMALTHDDVARALPVMEQARVLLLQLEVPLDSSLGVARRMRALGGLTILDPAPAPVGGLPPSVWGAVDIMTPNETETEALVGIRPTDETSASRAAAAMVERGLHTAIVKMGAAGVYYRCGQEAGAVPAFPVRAIDTVAAGDCFNGGLAYALARSDALPDAVRFACACGALATTRRGAADAAPTLDEVAALLALQPA